MNKIIIGGILFAIPFQSSAEIKLISEVLVGQSQHKLDSSIQTEGWYSDAIFEKTSTSSKDNSFGLRLGLKVTNNFTLELAKHTHGSFDNEITVSNPYPIIIPGCNKCVDYHVSKVKAKIDSSSIRYGIKGELAVFSGLSVNARLGIARWEDKQEYTPEISGIIESPSNEQKGNDLYYALGVSYRLTTNLNIGLEYSLVTINDRMYIDNEIVDLYKRNIEDLSIIIGWEF